MSNLSQFVGGARPPRVLINSTSTTGAAADNFDISAGISGGGIRTSLSGSLSAGVLATALSVTGAGEINLFAAVGVDATSRTHRIRCTIDGTVVYDATTAAAAATFRGIVLIGQAISTTQILPVVVRFNQSLLIEYASSVSESAKTQFAFQYRTY